jgi:hypothetical protein
MRFDWRLFRPKAIRVLAWCLLQLFLIQGPPALAQFGGGGVDGGSSGSGGSRGEEGGMCAPECWCSGIDCPVPPFPMCQGCPQGEDAHEESPGGTSENPSQEDPDAREGHNGGTSLACLDGTPCNLAYLQSLLICLGEVDVLPSLPPGFPAPPPGIEDPLRILRRVISPGLKNAIDTLACSVCAEAIDLAFSFSCQGPLVQGPWELSGGVADLCLENAVSGGSSTYLTWLWDAYENQVSCAVQGVP